MHRILVQLSIIAAVLMFTFTLTGCYTVKFGDEMKSTDDGKTYSNNDLGFSIDLPAEFEYTVEEHIKDDIGNSNVIVTVSDPASSITESVSEEYCTNDGIDCGFSPGDIAYRQVDKTFTDNVSINVHKNWNNMKPGMAGLSPVEQFMGNTIEKYDIIEESITIDGTDSRYWAYSYKSPKNTGIIARTHYNVSVMASVGDDTYYIKADAEYYGSDTDIVDTLDEMVLSMTFDEN